MTAATFYVGSWRQKPQFAPSDRSSKSLDRHSGTQLMQHGRSQLRSWIRLGWIDAKDSAGTTQTLSPSLRVFFTAAYKVFRICV